MTFDTETARAAGIDPEELKAAAAFISGMMEIGEEAREKRVAFIRALADMARENKTARAKIKRLLQPIERKYPQEAATFRAYYLEGEKHQSARQIARVLCMDTCTVYRHNRRVLEAMLAPMFGVYGYFPSDAGHSEALTKSQEQK